MAGNHEFGKLGSWGIGDWGICDSLPTLDTGPARQVPSRRHATLTPGHADRAASELGERAARTERGSWGPASEPVGGNAGAKPPALKSRTRIVGAMAQSGLFEKK